MSPDFAAEFFFFWKSHIFCAAASAAPFDLLCQPLPCLCQPFSVYCADEQQNTLPALLPTALSHCLHSSLTALLLTASSHSHHRFTNSNTSEDKYKCNYPKFQITVSYVTASRSIPIQLFSFLRSKSNLNFNPVLSESHKKSKTKMDTFIPTSWHCLQNSSSLKWLHSCGVPGEPRRMCPHNTKIRSRNSPQPLSTSLPPFLLFTNLGIFPLHKYLIIYWAKQNQR